MIVAITGCIGSGKSYVASLLRNKNFLTFDCDAIVKASYEDSKVKENLNNAFHCIINGKVNKQVLKEQLVNQEEVERLNHIIHPYVLKQIIALKENYLKEIVFVEIPLVYELSWQKYFDKVVCIKTNVTLRNERLKKRDQTNYNYLKRLEKQQWSEEEKVANADFVLQNENKEEQVLLQVDKLIDFLKQSY